MIEHDRTNAEEPGAPSINSDAPAAPSKVAVRADTIQILNVPVHRLTVDALNNQIAALIDSDQHALVLNVNVHCLNLAAENPWLEAFLNEAEIVFCDGAGVVLGARLLGHSMPPRITYADWMWQLADFAEQRGDSMFFLGAKPDVADLAAARLQERHPKLRIVGTQHGYFDQTVGSAENEAVLARINALEPNFLVLGMGMPLQEKWLMENWARVEANVALTGGAVFDYISGELQRAPEWMTNNHLEWLGRLAIEPGRLWRRYVLGNPRFLARVLDQRIRGH